MSLRFVIRALILAAVLSPGQPTALLAQEVERSVVGNAGEAFTDPAFGTLNFTVGEVAAENLAVAAGSLAQGFHRGNFRLVVSTRNNRLPEWEVVVYPNPTTDELHLRTDAPGTLSAELFSTAGQLLLRQPDLSAGQRIDVARLPAGTYWLRLRAGDGRTGTFQVQKISR